MKGIVCICLFAVVATALARPHEEGEKYTDTYDDTNVDEILENERLLKAYIDCLLGKGKCTAQGKELLSHIKDALENDCAKCTDKQKEQVDKVFARLINYHKAAWEELTEKFDPENKYTKKHGKRIENLKQKA